MLRNRQTNLTPIKALIWMINKKNILDLEGFPIWRMYYADLGECYPPQPPLFDLYNSSDHTQPGPIIAKYLILLFQLVLDGNWWFRDRTWWGYQKEVDSHPIFLSLFLINYLFIYFIYFSSLNLLSLVGVNLIIIHVFSTLMTVERCSCFLCSFLM